jgi:hypothetical protein
MYMPQQESDGLYLGRAELMDDPKNSGGQVRGERDYQLYTIEEVKRVLPVGTIIEIDQDFAESKVVGYHIEEDKVAGPTAVVDLEMDGKVRPLDLAELNQRWVWNEVRVVMKGEGQSEQ